MEDLGRLSAVGLFSLVERGEVSGAEVRDSAIAACERLDPTVHFLASPLFERAPPGVPMLLKDAGQELAGTRHYVGVAALRDAGNRSSATTPLAARFEDVGFSIIGKSACPRLAGGITTEPPGFEPTRNPWDLSRSAGGSSGGSAAAVASGVVPVAHGSDATGSLRCPAALCGLVTLNPTAGRIPSVPPAGQPAGNVWRDFVVARHAADLTMVFDRLTGTRADGSTRTLRVGLLDHDPELGIPVHPACREAAQVAAQLLEDLGHHVDQVWPAALNQLWASTFAAFAVVSDATRPVMVDWVTARLGRRPQPGELDDETFEAAARAVTRTENDLVAAQRAISGAVAAMSNWWTDHDLLVTPTTFQPAWPLGGTPGPRELGTLVAPFSLSGQPALSVPVHRSAEGLPVGAQLVARAGADALLLQLAEQLERATEWTAVRPALAG